MKSFLGLSEKEFCSTLADHQAAVILENGCDADDVPRYCLRRVKKAINIQITGKHSVWGILLDRPLGNGVEALGMRHILAIKSAPFTSYHELAKYQMPGLSNENRLTFNRRKMEAINSLLKIK